MIFLISIHAHDLIIAARIQRATHALKPDLPQQAPPPKKRRKTPQRLLLVHKSPSEIELVYLVKFE